MSKKTIIAVSAVLTAVIALIAGVILILPKETVINETMRFYTPKEFRIDDYSDDTPFTELSEKYVDAKVNLRFLRGPFTCYVDGTIEMGGQVISVYDDDADGDEALHGLYAVLIRRNLSETSFLRITEDLKYFDFYLGFGDYEGSWINTDTLGDYKKMMKSFYPNWE